MAHRRTWRQRRADDDEAEDFRLRRGRFDGLDPDTEDRPQVMPVRRPDNRADETHHVGSDGIRVREDAPGDGPWGEDDDGH
jgi:hypothetical protein